MDSTGRAAVIGAGGGFRGFRADLDGLRAMAIIGVVAFHAFPGLVPGGFVGVDIFFVISGYLISKGITERLQAGRFSLIEFYGRRAGRLFPALATVMVATLVCGWYLLTPEQFRQLGRHAQSAAGFAQNFVLWSESGYFDSVADSKPLLHLWSLAIEEQFYIFWPLGLMAMFSHRSRVLLWTLFIALSSFAANLYLAQVDPAADFCSPLSRMWELMIGSLLAQGMAVRPAPAPRQAAFLSVAGVILILEAALLFDSETSYPGWLALLPTAGAALVIASGPGAWVNRVLLSGRLMTWLGVVSYPLYLWHWPVLSMLGLCHGAEPTVAMRAAAVVASIGLAWCTYRFVEVPIRFRMAWGRRLPLCLGTMFSIFFVGLASASDVIPSRLGGADRAVFLLDGRPSMSDMLAARGIAVPKGSYFIEPDATEETLVIGDESVERDQPWLRHWMRGKEGVSSNAVFVTAAGCAPLNQLMRRSLSCEHVLSLGQQLIERPEVRTVVLGACWPCYLAPGRAHDYAVLQSGRPYALSSPEASDLLLAQIERQLRSLAAPGRKVVLALDAPAFGSAVSAGDEAAFSQRLREVARRQHVDVIAYDDAP